MSSGEEPPLLPTPSTFSDGLAPTRIVVACTFDPLGLQGPLHVWLHSLTGLRCEISWVGYGMVLDAVADASSAWGSNDGGLNVLLLRWCDMRRANYSALEDAAALLLEALRASIARRGAPTLVLLPPPAADGDGGEAATALTAELRAIGGACVVVDSGEHGVHEHPMPREVVVRPGHELLADLGGGGREVGGPDLRSEEDKVLCGGEVLYAGGGNLEWGEAVGSFDVQVDVPMLELSEHF